MRLSHSRSFLLVCCVTVLAATAGCVDEQQAAADRQRITTTLGDAEAASGQLQQAFDAANAAKERLEELIAQQQAATDAAIARFEALIAEQQARADDQQAAEEARQAARQLAEDIAAQKASVEAESKRRVDVLKSQHDTALATAAAAGGAVETAAATVAKIKQRLADFDAQMDAARNPGNAPQVVGAVVGGLSANPELGALASGLALAGLGWLHQWRAKKIAKGERDSIADIATVAVQSVELLKKLEPGVKEAIDRQAEKLSKLQGPAVKAFVDQVQRDALLTHAASLTASN